MQWQSPETIPMDGTEILIRTRIGIVSAWFCNEEYEWVCYDDMFQLDGHYSNIIGWIPIPEEENDNNKGE